MNAPTVLGLPLLSLLVWLPAAGAVLVLCLPRRWARGIHVTAFVVSLLDVALSVPLYLRFQLGTARMQFVEDLSWIPSVGARDRKSVV